MTTPPSSGPRWLTRTRVTVVRMGIAASFAALAIISWTDKWCH